MKWILASTSPYRKILLQRTGLLFETQTPKVDEDEFKAKIKDPLLLSQTLAKAKAESLRKENPKAGIIGSDQVAAFEEFIFDKPGNKENAIATLKKLRGKSHQLITSVYIITPTDNQSFTDITSLVMKPLSDKQIATYVEIDKPFDCAGSYKLESQGIALFDKIESADFTAIQGLPLIELTKTLEKLGFHYPYN